MNDADYMRLAIAAAVQGVEEGQTPFGACIVRDGEVLSCSHNQVWDRVDITAHAEILAIREACRKIGSVDLSGSVIYSSCEPCPMCFSACHWARVRKIFFGAGIEDARRIGFNEITFSNHMMKEQGGSPLEVEGGFLKEEAQAVFRLWLEKKSCPVY